MFCVFVGLVVVIHDFEAPRSNCVGCCFLGFVPFRLQCMRGEPQDATIVYTNIIHIYVYTYM